MAICGIYVMRNLINGKVYIGQSVDIYNRLRVHEWNLKNNCHINNYLQKAFNKNGLENFKFEIIEQCPEEDLSNKEIYYIEKYRNTIQLYNLTNGGDGTRGHKHTEESKIKMRVARKGKCAGENNSFYGKTHSEDTRKKISLARLGKPGTWIGKTWDSGRSSEYPGASASCRPAWATPAASPRNPYPAPGRPRTPRACESQTTDPRAACSDRAD